MIQKPAKNKNWVVPAGADTGALGVDGTVQWPAVAGSTGAVHGDAHRVTDSSNIPNNFHQD